MALIHDTVRDGILFLEFHDSTSRNSFSVRAAEELAAVLARHLSSPAASSILGVVFHARGRVFCSGGNLNDYAQMTDPSQGMEVNRRITAILNQLAHLDLHTVCLVGGDCFGGGVELVSAFDRVLAVPHATFGLWQRRIALSFGWGGGARLERRLGIQKLTRLAMSTENLTAQDACDLGLVDEVVLEARGRERAIEIVHQLARLPKASIAALKNWDSSREQEIFESLWWNEEHRAVLARR